jgi:hypothetical protein
MEPGRVVKMLTGRRRIGRPKQKWLEDADKVNQEIEVERWQQ